MRLCVEWRVFYIWAVGNIKVDTKMNLGKWNLGVDDYLSFLFYIFSYLLSYIYYLLFFELGLNDSRKNSIF